MKYAEIEWQGEQAFSKSFGDIFFSRLGGLEESQHVFLALNDLAERFKKAGNFQIGELGLGTGLNFLLSWKLFEEVSPASARLHFISTEISPLRSSDMRHALSLWPEIVPFSEKLIAVLPLPIEGQHRISFSGGRVSLTLLYGDARDTLKNLELYGNKFDCWFLDGFSPQKNPQMWEAGLLETVTALTSLDGTLSTYSCAGFIKRALESSGWQVEKVPGFAQKRESLKGKLIKENNLPGQLKKPAPWFSLNKAQRPQARSAIIIGGGLAGCWSAYCLARKGIKVTLIEKDAKLAMQASGNPAGLAVPYLALDRNARQRFYASAFDYCRRELAALEAGGVNFNRKSCGVLHKLSRDRLETLVSRFEKLSIPDELAQAHSAEAIYYPNAGVLSPEILCQSLPLQFPELINIQLQTEALTLGYSENIWKVKNGEQVLAAADAVVMASSYEATGFPQTSWLPLTKIRGELIIVEDKNPARKLEHAMTGSGYLIALSENRFLAGASYDQEFLDPLPSSEIQAKLLEDSRDEFSVFSNKAGILSSRVAFRASTYDRLPYVGAVPELGTVLESYKEYKKGFPAESFPECSYLPGLYVNLGHGSRGVVSAPLCAEIVASMIAGEPLPIEKDLLPALLPMRWIMRELGRGGSKGLDRPRPRRALG